MTEVLIREQLDLQRRASERDEWEKLTRVRESLAELRTRFDAQINRFDEAQSRAVSGTDLKDLKREMEDQLKQTTNAIYEHFKSANDQQAQSILGQVKDLFGNFRNEQTQEQLQSTNAVLNAITERRSKVGWWILGIVGSVVVSVASTLIVVAILGRPD